MDEIGAAVPTAVAPNVRSLFKLAMVTSLSRAYKELNEAYVAAVKARVDTYELHKTLNHTLQLIDDVRESLKEEVFQESEEEETSLNASG
jgi:hypothetical protein